MRRREQAPLAVPMPYLRQIGEQVQAMGGDVALWLARHGLTAAALDDGAAEVPFATFEKLTADAMAREPALGLFVGQRLEVQTHGVLGYAAQSSGSVRQALGLFETFMQTRFALIGLSVTEERERVRVRFAEIVDLGAAQRPVLEAVVMATKNILDAISMGAARIDTVAFAFAPPTYAALASQLFGCTVRYGATWSGLTLPRDVLDTPLREADPLAFQEAVKICERELERLSANATFAGRVRRLLLERRHGFPSLEVAARLMRLTPRTLHRRLVEEETSFREILDDVRHRLALEHLKVDGLRLEEIAFTLGYTDFANFRRAFKRWESMPPTRYRERHANRRRGP